MPLEALQKDDEAPAPEETGVAYDTARVGQFLSALEAPKREIAPEGGRISVHAAVSRFAVLYERIRNAVDYREDHLLRKNAIERILKRQLLLENDPYVIANHLIRELIGARYLPNGELSESLVDEAATVVRKYQTVAKIRVGRERHLRWVQGVISAELEELLVRPTREKALLSFIYERLADRLTVRGVEMEDSERRLQIYVACYRSLVKADEDQVGFKLLRAYLPEWLKPDQWPDDPRPIAERLVATEQRVRDRLRHPLSQRFLRAIKPWTVALSILTEAVMEEKERAEMLTSTTDTHLAVMRVTERRERDAMGKLRRGTFRAMVYLFLTKMIFALAVELPLEWYWFGEISAFALAINLLFPPVLMLFVGSFIRRPGADNRERVLRAADDLLTKSGVPKQEIRVPRKRRGITLAIMRLLYAFTFFVSFGLVWSILQKLEFTWVASMIFFFFLCVVSFFGYRLRRSAREIIVVQPRERLSNTVMDFFALPILRVGQWLSQTVSRLNVFVFFLDFLFEAPFKLFLNVLEDWLGFVKEKKEELTEE